MMSSVDTSALVAKVLDADDFAPTDLASAL